MVTLELKTSTGSMLCSAGAFDDREKTVQHHRSLSMLSIRGNARPSPPARRDRQI